MTCERVTAVLDELAADAPAGPEHDELVEHISHCPRCAKVFREYTTLMQLAGTLNRITPPPGVEQRLRAVIAAALRREEEGIAQTDGDPHPPADVAD